MLGLFYKERLARTKRKPLRQGTCIHTRMSTVRGEREESGISETETCAQLGRQGLHLLDRYLSEEDSSFNPKIKKKKSSHELLLLSELFLNVTAESFTG